ncbi:hypothetical protein XA68_15590 [Ophiocordyceps unilateralis]|uniref:Chromosome segregation in meiosis protein n=1 Tax=Ophiocordyceps unilateralis TaxID=268505 RepID=A0A2A9P6A6_OPHUN|nr:hypothetical protein XA68_15590 [Ophiocordyceps unilateralis]
MPVPVASPRRLADLENYDVDDDSDPFRSPSPPRRDASPSAGQKRKAATGSSSLGLDEQVSVQKRARVPNVKLDQDRLLGPAGIPRLRARWRNVRIKGKGHEFADAERLLAFYQFWLDDLFPKARFLDALAMVEKAGHKKAVIKARTELIEEGKPRDRQEDDDVGDDFPPQDAAPTQTVDQSSMRPKTPERNDVPDEDDLYDATPRVSNRSANTQDDLDALVHCQETGRQQPAPNANAEPDEDDLDALIAEAEGLDRGGGDIGASHDSNRFSDEEAAMADVAA